MGFSSIIDLLLIRSPPAFNPLPKPLPPPPQQCFCHLIAETPDQRQMSECDPLPNPRLLRLFFLSCAHPIFSRVTFFHFRHTLSIVCCYHGFIPCSTHPSLISRVLGVFHSFTHSLFLFLFTCWLIDLLTPLFVSIHFNLTIATSSSSHSCKRPPPRPT